MVGIFIGLSGCVIYAGVYVGNFYHVKNFCMAILRKYNLGCLLYRKGGRMKARIDARSAAPDFLIPYINMGLKIENGRIRNIPLPEHLIADGNSLSADKDGFFIHTHRGRSKSRLDMNFTQQERDWVKSTG